MRVRVGRVFPEEISTVGSKELECKSLLECKQRTRVILGQEHINFEFGARNPGKGSYLCVFLIVIIVLCFGMIIIA